MDDTVVMDDKEQPPAYGDWHMARFCLYCKKYLSTDDYYNREGGVCIHCGTNSGYGLPDIVEKSRRKKYTDIRKLAIEAQKLRKSNVFVRFFSRVGSKSERPFVWEYRDDG